MQIIINIPDDDYDLVCKHVIDDDGHNVLPINVTYKVVTEIAKGIPLPEGHGRIADIDKVIKCIQEVEGDDAIHAISLIEWACSKRTIIEADEKENEQHVPDEIQEAATHFARVQETGLGKYSEEDIKQIANAFNILCAVTLFKKMTEKGILFEDPQRPSNILVYMRTTDEHLEGWYSQNVFVAAEDLLSDRQSLEYVLKEADKHGIDLNEILVYSKAMLDE